MAAVASGVSSCKDHIVRARVLIVIGKCIGPVITLKSSRSHEKAVAVVNVICCGQRAALVIMMGAAQSCQTHPIYFNINSVSILANHHQLVPDTMASCLTSTGILRGQGKGMDRWVICHIVGRATSKTWRPGQGSIGGKDIDDVMTLPVICHTALNAIDIGKITACQVTGQVGTTVITIDLGDTRTAGHDPDSSSNLGSMAAHTVIL